MKGALATLLALCAWAGTCDSASAEYSAASLVSGNATIPFEHASSPALSQDGRYVVFEGAVDGDSGVFRRDLNTGVVEPVAAGANEAINPVLSTAAADAAAPSVSADGRYVAFTSTAALDQSASLPSPNCPEVYVRDMDVAIGQPGAYTLASAISAQQQSEASRGIEYRGGCPTLRETGFEIAGAQAAPAVALSADGRKVAFTVLSASNLEGGSEGAQVAVRDLDTRQTLLVSKAYSAATDSYQGPVPGGGALPSAPTYQQTPLSSSSRVGEEITASTASISADGSTVAWLGTNVPEQVPAADDVTSGMSSLGGPAKEVEPLWRRLDAGAAAPTVRLLGNTGLNFYFTSSHSESNRFGVEGGSLYTQGEPVFVAPVLDSDGRTVAVTSNAPTPANEPSYLFTGSFPFLPPDAYVVRVSESTPQVTPLTITPSYAAAHASNDGVVDLALSTDGSHIAFNTERTSFALAPPSLISPPAPEAGRTYTYVADLPLGTLQRVTHTVQEASPNGDAGSIALSGDGQTIAFGSGASNLIFGSPTSGVSQVYLAHELPAPSVLGRQEITVAPQLTFPAPAWVLSATASVLKDGTVALIAEVPSAGKLSARLDSQLPGFATSGPHPRLARSRKAAHSRRRVAARRATAQLLLATEAVSSGPGELRLKLHVSARFNSLLHSPSGLYCLLQVTFSAPGKRRLTQVIPLTVHAVGAHTASRSRRNRRHRPGKIG